VLAASGWPQHTACGCPKRRLRCGCAGGSCRCQDGVHLTMSVCAHSALLTGGGGTAGNEGRLKRPCWPQHLLASLRVLQVVTQLAQGLQCSQEAVLWCKERAARAGSRAAALVPALQELERAVLAPGQGVEIRLVESISIILVLLAKVCPLLVPAVGVGGLAVPWSWCS
jgi:hypothetical protein